MRVLVISETAWPGVDGEVDGDLLVVARPLDALHGHRFDLIVAPTPVTGTIFNQAWTAWWVDSVMCRLVPNGRVVLV